MILEMKRIVIEIERRGVVPFEDGVGTRIDCLSGCIWITEWHSTDDIVLQAGESYVITKGGAAIVQALHGALVALQAPMPGFGTWMGWLRSCGLLPACGGHPIFSRPKAG
jgi:hypothetical protein